MKAVGRGVLCFAVIALVFAVFVQVMFSCPSRGRKEASNANCESNMKQIGTATKMYLPDWDDQYPTNRAWTSDHKAGQLVSHVKLTPQQKGAVTNPGMPQYGPNWVEALYKYTEQVSDSGTPVSAWRCPKAKTVSSRDSGTASASYAFNQNLCENCEGVIKGADHLMMVREMDRLGNSELRPINYSTQDPDTTPISPFLTKTDREMGLTRPYLHYNGSHVLFADGHVKLYTRSYLPSDRFITRHNCWDPETKQWYNFGPGLKGGVPPAMVESIAITP